MVLSRAPLWPQWRRPQPIRISGLSAAIVINVAIFLLLSLPRDSAVPLPVKAKADPPPIEWIQQPPEPMVMEVPPLPVPPDRPQQWVVELPQPTAAPVVVEHAALPVPVERPVMPFTAGPAVEVEVSLAPTRGQVRYLFAPPPRYPGPALRAGAEGTVLLRVLIGIDGRPRQVEIEQTSGHTALDRAASEQVSQRWRFEPAMQNGGSVEAWVLVPVEFTIPR
jgi:periplasmic protein TonB